MFLHQPLRHFLGPVGLLWGGGSIHKDEDVTAFRRRKPGAEGAPGLLPMHQSLIPPLGSCGQRLSGTWPVAL